MQSYTIRWRFPASAERLFHALTSPEDLAAWIWGPRPKDFQARVDLRPGGTFDISMREEGPGGESRRVGMRGVYIEVDSARRLVHTLHWDADVGYNAPGAGHVDEAVVLELEPTEDGCCLWYTHHGIPDDGRSAAEHERSVRATFDLLERHLSRS